LHLFNSPHLSIRVKFIFQGEDRHPQIFEGLRENLEITADIDKQMTDALTAYDTEFQDTIK
jgi:hypothetical protein